MAVRIRLKKLGRKKRPFYRVVAIDSRFKRDGREIERLGWYDPVQDSNSCNLNEDRILYWLKQGAKPSDTVQGLFRKNGLSYKWHLSKQGVKDADIDKLLEEWKEREKNRIELKKDKKIKKKELAANADTGESVASEEEAPAEEVKAEEAPVEKAPAEEVKAEEAPVEETPAEEVKAEEASVEEVKAEEAPVEEVKVEEAPEEEVKAEEAPADEVKAEEAPIEEAPAEEVKAEETPADEVKAEEAPIEEAPAEEVKAEETPAEQVKEQEKN